MAYGKRYSNFVDVRKNKLGNDDNSHEHASAYKRSVEAAILFDEASA